MYLLVSLLVDTRVPQKPPARTLREHLEGGATTEKRERRESVLQERDSMREQIARKLLGCSARDSLRSDVGEYGSSGLIATKAPKTPKSHAHLSEATVPLFSILHQRASMLSDPNHGA